VAVASESATEHCHHHALLEQGIDNHEIQLTAIAAG